MKYKSMLQRGVYSLKMLLVLVVLTAMHSGLSAQGMTPQHVAKIQNVSNALISPDGNYIAYTKSVPADPYEENKPASSHLYVYNMEADESRPFYTVGSISGLTYRPGHKTLTFLAQREGDDTRSLYELPLNGGEAVKIFSFERSISAYDWQQDGNHIVFMSYDKPGKSESPLPYSTNVYEENVTNRRAFITNVTHTEKDHAPHEINVEGSVYNAEWSPNGEYIAVSAAPTPAVDDYYMFQSVYVVEYKTREVVSEIQNEGKLGQIEWSPDGEQLALRAAADINDPIDGRIMIVDAMGSEKPEIITPDFKGKYEFIRWSDDDRIDYLASKGTSVVIGYVDPDGDDREELFTTNSMSISSMDKADNGQVAFTASTPEHPSELFVLNEGTPERVTFNNEWLSDLKLGKQEVIEYETRDGEFTIQGIMIYPVDYNEGDEIPLITMVHGGPEAHYSNGWLTGYSIPGQVAAAEGFGVFYPNYRGSTGRGIDFAYSSQGDLAGAEFDDIVDGVDYLIDEGIADEDRIGVTGGSYGGYASGWMSTYYSDRFAAAVMFVGISNNISKWGTSDIPEELYYVHARKRIWKDYMGYLKRSPIYYVDRAETPILIMHGEEDTRVHPAQSMELFRHLKVRKPEVPLRLVYYPGEGHGNRSASAQLEYNYRMLRWFNTYLKTGDADAEKPSWDVEVPEKM